MVNFSIQGIKTSAEGRKLEAQSKLTVWSRCSIKRYEINILFDMEGGLHCKKNCTFTWGSKLCREVMII